MLHKRLSLALSFLVILGSVIVATRYISGQANQQRKPVSMTVLRGKERLKDKPTSQEIASLEVTQDRKLKTRDFKGMPVSLVEVRNLQSETWYEDLEIELKNVSGKPIYFLTAYLEFPDDMVGGTVYGVALSWGEPKKLDSQKYVVAEAANVEPGKTFVLTIPEMYRKGLRAMHRMRPHVTKNLKLWFEKTYFGDGTGFDAEGRWRDFRGKGPPPKPEKKHHSRSPGKSALTR